MEALMVLILFALLAVLVAGGICGIIALRLVSTLGRKLRNLKDEVLFQQRDLLLKLGLFVLGIVVLCIFGDVTEISGLANALRDFASTDGRELLDLFFELFQTFGGDFRLATHLY